MKQSLLNASASTSSVKTKLAWRAAGDLRPGDRVVTKDGRVGVVKATKPVGQLSTVHNFAVEDTHTYFVGTGPGVWVHNIYKPRVLTKQAELSPADVVKSEALAERYKQATQGLEGQDKNLAGNAVIDTYLDENNLSQSDIIAGGTTEGAILSRAVFNNMNLNALQGTDIGLGGAHHLLVDAAYRNEVVPDMLEGGKHILRSKNAYKNNIRDFVHYDLPATLNEMREAVLKPIPGTVVNSIENTASAAGNNISQGI